MSPESISAYLKHEAIQACVSGIENCPIPVLIEFPDGEEFPIIKAYEIMGRTAAIKILVDCEAKDEIQRNKISDLEDSNKIFEEENKFLEEERDELKDELEKWTNDFGDDPESTKTLWDEIEEAVRHFGQIAEINLVSNDATNICRLQDEYEDKAKLLLETDEIIAELKKEIAALKVDNQAMAWNIERLEIWKENTLKDENPTLN